MAALLRLLGLKSDFEQLFYINEYKTLSGEKRRIILALILILFLTLLALGYAIGSLQNLERKVSNPFTNWVDLSVTEAYISNKAKDIERDYSEPKKREALQLADVRGWIIFNLDMYHSDFNPLEYTNDTMSYPSWGRSLDIDDPILEKILEEDNLIWKHPDWNLEEKEVLSNCEIIITEKMINRLGYDATDPEVGSLFIRENDKNIFAVKVVGVIKALPKFCNFVCSSELYNIKNAKRAGRKNCADLMKINREGESIYSYIVSGDAEEEELQSLVETFFHIQEPPALNIAEQIISGKKRWNLCEVSFLPSTIPPLDSIDLFLNFLAKNGNKAANIIQLECSTDHCSNLDPVDYHYLAFNFNRLDDIRRFKVDIDTTHNIEIDMGQVAAKENFALVSRLTLVISLILLGFGILSIILFVNSLLRSHLFKVRSNLGTFKAFGLSNRFLNTIYLKIIFSFLGLSISVALIASIIVDRIEHFILLKESQFNIFSSWVLFALLGLVLISLYISSRTIKKILGDTPGNLIYER